MTFRRVALVLPILLSGACLVGPAYRKPSSPVPKEYRENAATVTAGVALEARSAGDASRRGLVGNLRRS